MRRNVLFRWMQMLKYLGTKFLGVCNWLSCGLDEANTVRPLDLLTLTGWIYEYSLYSLPMFLCFKLLLIKMVFFHESSERWGDWPKVTQLMVELKFAPGSYLTPQPGLQAVPVRFSSPKSFLQLPHVTSCRSQNQNSRGSKQEQPWRGQQFQSIPCLNNKNAETQRGVPSAHSKRVTKAWLELRPPDSDPWPRALWFSLQGQPPQGRIYKPQNHIPSLYPHPTPESEAIRFRSEKPHILTSGRPRVDSWLLPLLVVWL